MDKDFKAVLARLRSLRMTEKELQTAAGMNVVRYWRAKNNKVGVNARIKVLRELEAVLDQVEKGRTNNAGDAPQG